MYTIDATTGLLTIVGTGHSPAAMVILYRFNARDGETSHSGLATLSQPCLHLSSPSTTAEVRQEKIPVAARSCIRSRQQPARGLRIPSGRPFRQIGVFCDFYSSCPYCPHRLRFRARLPLTKHRGCGRCEHPDVVPNAHSANLFPVIE